MKFEKGVYPNFYGDYQQIIEEKTKIFVGRKIWLKLYWDRLYSLAKDEKETVNKALLAHRKTGKTSFLRKLYNLAFTQQREVIPFYYEFSTEKKHGKTLCRKIQETLICQATDFLLGEKYFIKDGRFDKCLKKLEELNTEWSINILDRYKEFLKMEQITPEIRFNELLSAAWKFVHEIDDKPCLLIIDEAQELAKSLYAIGDKEKIIPSHYSLASVHNFQSIWILLSGSRISELYYNMVGALANRITKQDFYLFDKQDTNELITTLLELYGYQVYPEIYEHIWNITKGHPFYIQKIFDPNIDNYVQLKNKEKSFTSLEELAEVLNFEITNEKGELYLFWKNHFVENLGCLDDGKDKKGTTLQILYYIASHKDKTIPYKEIAEKFEIEDIDEKIHQLIMADLVEIEATSQVVNRLNDSLLSLYLANRYTMQIFGNKSEKEIRLQVDKLIERIVGEKFLTLTKTVSKHTETLDAHGTAIKDAQTQLDGVTIKLTTMGSRVESIEGKVNYLHGTEYENETRERIEEALKQGEGIFQGMEFVVPLASVNVYDSDDKALRQLDACGEVNIGGEKVGLLVEAKNWDKTVGIPQVRKFIKAITIVQKDKRWKRMMCLYISESGLSKSAQELLTENGIIFGTSSELLSNTKNAKDRTTKKTKKNNNKTTKAKTTGNKSKTKVKAKKVKTKATKTKAKTTPSKNTKTTIKRKSAS